MMIVALTRGVVIGEVAVMVQWQIAELLGCAPAAVRIQKGDHETRRSLAFSAPGIDREEYQSRLQLIYQDAEATVRHRLANLDTRRVRHGSKPTKD